MGFLDNVLKVFVGDKSKKDLGDIQPYVEEVKSHEAALEKLSIDELRAKSDVFRNIIKADQKEIQDEIEKINLNLSKIEKIKKFFITKNPFTIENNMMTPTLKLKRYKIIKNYKTELEKLF